jgi:hypothetical protein
MVSDSSPPQHRDQQIVNLSQLPEVVSLAIRRRHFDPPRRVTKKGVDQFVREAVEFEVRISEPFPVRALGAALWVGNEALTSADVDGLTYHFFAFEPDKLTPNASISLGWSSPSEGRRETRFRFTTAGN